MRTKGEAAEAAQHAIAHYQHQAAEFEAEGQAITADRDSVATEAEQISTALGALLLPDASPQALAQAAQEARMPELPGLRQELEAQRTSWAQELAALEQDPNYINREALTDPQRGSLATEAAQCQQHLATSRQRLAQFAIPDFDYLQKRALQKQMNSGGFSDFWRAVTLAERRENTVKERCCQALGCPNWEAATAEYNQHLAFASQVETRLGQLEAHRAQVEEVIKKHAELYYWVHYFEQSATRALQLRVGAHLKRQNLKVLQRSVRPAARRQVAHLHGLAAKWTYLNGMAAFAAKEATDRRGRVEPLARCARTWSAKPWAQMLGNKTKWLVTLPAMKQEAARKRLRWTRTMRKNVYEYDDWDDYDDYMWDMEEDEFLPYDAFAHGSDERMPYEGFTRSCIPELDAHRHTCGLEKADYSHYKAIDKQEGSDGGHSADGSDGGDGADGAHEDGHSSDHAEEAVAAMLVAEDVQDLVDAS